MLMQALQWPGMSHLQDDILTSVGLFGVKSVTVKYKGLNQEFYKFLITLPKLIGRTPLLADSWKEEGCTTSWQCPVLCWLQAIRDPPKRLPHSTKRGCCWHLFSHEEISGMKSIHDKISLSDLKMHVRCTRCSAGTLQLRVVLVVVSREGLTTIPSTVWGQCKVHQWETILRACQVCCPG